MVEDTIEAYEQVLSKRQINPNPEFGIRDNFTLTYNQGIDIDAYDKGSNEWVVPWEIFADDDVDIIGHISKEPIDVVSTDPLDNAKNVGVFKTVTIRFSNPDLELGPNKDAIKLVDQFGKEKEIYFKLL